MRGDVLVYLLSMVGLFWSTKSMHDRRTEEDEKARNEELEAAYNYGYTDGLQVAEHERKTKKR